MKVDILDIGSGNIRSIKNWIEKANVATNIVTEAKNIKSDLLILPGVGSAGPYMSRLRKGGYDQALIEHVDKGGRLLGICLGFQILSSFSEEDGGVKGLNLVDGYVERLQNKNSHNGWESIYLRKNEMNGQTFFNQHSLTKKRVLDGRVFYNHEFGFINRDSNAFSIKVSDGLNKYSGLLIKNKIIGIQFHPEKSQMTGLELISMIL